MQTSLSSYFKRAPLSPSCGAVPPLAKRARITAATIQQEVGDSSVDGVKVEEGWKEVIAPETQKGNSVFTSQSHFTVLFASILSETERLSSKRRTKRKTNLSTKVPSFSCF